jgi:hypothetical protein
MLIRKQISLFLAFFLLVSNLGLAFTIHYCNNKVASITLKSIPDSAVSNSGCCGTLEKKSKCCHDTIIKSENKVDQILVDFLSFNPVFLVTAEERGPMFSTETLGFKKADSILYYCDANAPPLYLLYNQYTFYS